MILRLIVCAILMMLSACGKNADDSNSNHGYGYYYDAIGVEGLRLRHAPDQTLPAVSDVERIYLQTAFCMGMIAADYPFPLVVMNATIPSPTGERAYGGTYIDTGLILITDDATDVNYWQSVYKHEFVHYLLMQSNYPLQDNIDHRSHYFYDCVYN